MRPLTIYLTCYYALIAGAFVALFRAGVLESAPVGWTMTVAISAVALGVVLRVLSRK